MPGRSWGKAQGPLAGVTLSPWDIEGPAIFSLAGGGREYSFLSFKPFRGDLARDFLSPD